MKAYRTLAFLMGALTLLISPVCAQVLNSAERLADANSFQEALEYNRSGTSTSWRNPDTANRGATVPVKTFQLADGTYCREFRQTIIIAGREEQGFGTACRQADGHWAIVNPASLRAPAEKPAPVTRVRVYEPWYPAYAPAYVYPYFPGYLSLSFGYIEHRGYSRHGHHYPRGYKSWRHDRRPFHDRHDRHRGNWGRGRWHR